MSEIDTWYERIAKKARVTEAEVIGVLADEGIPGKRALPERRRLRVDAVHFAGVKDRQAPDGGRLAQPFAFTQELTTPITAFATQHRNDAGKSSVLEVILWAVRGYSSLASDVRAWMRHAVVAIRVGDQPVLVAWKINDKVPDGCIIELPKLFQLDWAELNGDADAQMRANVHDTVNAYDEVVDAAMRAGARVVDRFANAEEFKRAVASFMNDRLGFERTDTFKRNRHATDDTDGQVVTHDWPLWSQALLIPKKNITVTLGEDATSASYVVETYLGTGWGAAVAAARTRKKTLEGQTASIRRAQERDEADRDMIIAGLEAELAEVESERKTLPEQDNFTALEDLTRRLRRATQAAADADTAYVAALSAHTRLYSQLGNARADEVAAQEAALTERFWHSLKPSCCPRCDAKVDASRWAREDDGQCSLCDSTLAPEPAATAVDVQDEKSDDDADIVQVANDRVVTLEIEFAEAANILRDAERTRDDKRGELDAVRLELGGQTVDPSRRVELDTRIAVLNGRIQERSATVARPADLAAQERIISVLDVVEKESAKLRTRERGDLLAAVSAHIVELGRRLGFRELESAKFGGNGHLPIVKGGQPENFGALTEGEKLRLKIAIVIALLRVGTAAGVGRHPGLLVLDSPASEEMNPADLRQLLQELQLIAEETGLQVITSSANGDLLVDALPAGSVRLARDEDDDFLW
uniref:Putative large ATP-binding protein n=1 Tax=Arthrobacter sp. 31.31 TaxID=347202 RepID=I3VZE2_9MICC|nr:hypothetical protein [Arthrobacter sp. 31.31]AFK88719.1 putative large ATP-binding protein [Arthrobacter sp. 31.31]